MGILSYQLAYKVSQGEDHAINFSFAIKPSSENMIVITDTHMHTHTQLVGAKHDTGCSTWIM